MIAPVDLCRILETGRFDLSDEKACQAEIIQWLAAYVPEGSGLRREPRLSARDIPDFMVDGIAVEVKMNSAQPRSAIRQLGRYAAHEEVRALILASNRAIALPSTLNGKPVFAVSLGKAWL